MTFNPDPSKAGTTPLLQWADPAEAITLHERCPICGDDAPKPVRLTVRLSATLRHGGEWRVLGCAGCTGWFFEKQVPPDYAAPALLEAGQAPFYLQQGAGLSLITRPLARLRVPPGATYLEVGCGFGFGVDYAARAKGWDARGIDPGAIAAVGAATLGLRIERRYLGAEEPELAGRFDVVMASETIEHVPSPAGFLHILRAALCPSGVLVLTTPDAADLVPANSPGVLIPLLSPGLHLALYNAAVLRRLLSEAGFAHIEVEKDGHSLVAVASDRPLALERDPAPVRSEYLSYLTGRAADVPDGSDLFFAFAGRAFQEAVNAALFDDARPARAGLDRACLSRFGHSLDALAGRLETFAGASLKRLATLMPLNLAGLLYADAVLRLHDGAPRAAVLPGFEAAARAADLLRQALAALSMEDGMAEDIRWIADAEALLCAAAAGDQGTLSRLAALPPAPSGRPGRRQLIAARAFVGLVNAGHYSLARSLADAEELDGTAWADPACPAQLLPEQRDALFCLGVLDMQGDDAEAGLQLGLARFLRVRQSIVAADRSGLHEAATTGARLALDRMGRTAEAAAL